MTDDHIRNMEGLSDMNDQKYQTIQVGNYPTQFFNKKSVYSDSNQKGMLRDISQTLQTEFNTLNFEITKELTINSLETKKKSLDHSQEKLRHTSQEKRRRESSQKE